jgi:hypothetical protein
MPVVVAVAVAYGMIKRLIGGTTAAIVVVWNINNNNLKLVD